MQAFGMARIGRDVETRSTPSGQTVANVSLAFTFGRKDQDGKRPTQWVDASFWGERAAKLAPYLTKGKLIVVTLEDVHVQAFQRSDGTSGSKLVGSIITLDLVPGQQQSEQTQAPAPAPRPAPAPAPRTAPKPTGFDDMDDDIPF